MASGLTGPHAATASELKGRMDAQRRGQPFLILRDADEAQVIVELRPGEAEIRRIGRSVECDIALPWDSQVSRVHAELMWVGTDWAIDDRGLSRNGTFVNGQRLGERRRLHDGDTLRLGGTLILFRRPEDTRTVGSLTVTAASLPGPKNVSEAQGAVLRALCRPLAVDEGRSSPATNREIADALFLSLDAVKSHMRMLFQKFGVEDLPQNQKRLRLAERALETGAIVLADLRDE
jgi:pSer/pThr/pTyr-binding forkhead associated (FHA) protein